MTLAFWYWFFMVIWFVFGGWIGYRRRAGAGPELAPFYQGVGWNVFLFIILCILGWQVFGNPFSTLVK